MKKALWVALALLLVCVFALSACNNEKSQADSMVTFATLTVDGNNVTGEVANEITTFSFLEEIEANEGVEYSVSLDIYGKDVVPTKTVALHSGDNKFYVLATLKDQSKVYTVTIRRRPIYSVVFDTDGGTAIKMQSIEEGKSVTAPDIPTKDGYTFIKWNYEFENVVMSDIVIKAEWASISYEMTYDANGGSVTNNKQTVNYGSSYTLETPTKNGYTFVGWYEGEKRYYDGVWETPQNVTLKAKWDINNYYVSVNGTSGGSVSGEGRYEYNSTVTVSAKSKLGYTWLGWFDDNNNIVSNQTTYTFTLGDSSVVLKAKWKTSDDIADFVFTSTETTCTITDVVDDSKTTYIIPSYVTSIGDWAFFMCDYLTNITIPNGVTSIGEHAFSGCNKLSSVEIPNSVTNIGANAFSSCDGLTSIVIPEKVTSINEYAFSSCSNLTSIVIHSEVTFIGKSAFSGCIKLTNITFRGTTSMWNSITLGNNWNHMVPATNVICSNGTITIE